MAQFRYGSDILDEILQKAGEPTNGNSPFETLARTYANKVNNAIICGGNIFSIKVDESWAWARSRHPINIELQPEYSTGNVTCTLGSTAVTFGTAPADSLEGWFLQVSGKSTVYKITQHSAGGATAAIDANFVNTSGGYSFRAFKLDYEILPTHVYIDDYNDKIDFQEGTAFTTRTASLTHGSYTLTGIIAHAVTQMAAVSTSSITGSYNAVLKQYNVTCGSSLRLLGATGANVRISGLQTLGFDTLDYTAAQSYTSTYIPNGIGRLVEPFKVFTNEEKRITSTDPIGMANDYPMDRARRAVPTKFTKIAELGDGTVWVRFNSYPSEKTKVQIDWTPKPIDIQDNTASVVKFPRADIDTLIHGAASFIAFDKSDSKFQTMIQLTSSGLEAMEKKNRSEMFRTGPDFAQIIPREDLAGTSNGPNYGYTSGD